MGNWHKTTDQDKILSQYYTSTQILLDAKLKHVSTDTIPMPSRSHLAIRCTYVFSMDLVESEMFWIIWIRCGMLSLEKTEAMSLPT